MIFFCLTIFGKSVVIFFNLCIFVHFLTFKFFQNKLRTMYYLMFSNIQKALKIVIQVLTVDFWCEKVKLALLKKYCAPRISRTSKLFSFLLVLRTNASKFLGEKFFGSICSSGSQSCSSHDHFHGGHIHILSELVYLQLVNKTLTKIRNRSYIWIFFVKHSSEKEV